MADQGPIARNPRRRVVVHGVLETLDGATQVEVRNLSTTGALIEGPGIPPVGRGGVLKTGSLDCFGIVVWSDGSRCGLRFEEPISFAQVLDLHTLKPADVQRQDLEATADWFRSADRYARL